MLLNLDFLGIRNKILIFRYCHERKVLQIVLHLNFISPLILVLLWIRPISHDYLTVRIFSGMSKPL